MESYFKTTAARFNSTTAARRPSCGHRRWAAPCVRCRERLCQRNQLLGDMAPFAVVSFPDSFQRIWCGALRVQNSHTQSEKQQQSSHAYTQLTNIYIQKLIHNSQSIMNGHCGDKKRKQKNIYATFISSDGWMVRKLCRITRISCDWWNTMKSRRCVSNEANISLKLVAIVDTELTEQKVIAIWIHPTTIYDYDSGHNQHV